MAYSELLFTDTLWPDFRRKDLYEAVLEYQARDRRFRWPEQVGTAVAHYRDSGVIVRTHKLGEADRILSIITESNGKVRAVAKGVRKSLDAASMEDASNPTPP